MPLNAKGASLCSPVHPCALGARGEWGCGEGPFVIHQGLKVSVGTVLSVKR